MQIVVRDFQVSDFQNLRIIFLQNRQTAFNQAMEESPAHFDSKTDIIVKCPELNILLR